MIEFLVITKLEELIYCNLNNVEKSVENIINNLNKEYDLFNNNLDYTHI